MKFEFFAFLGHRLTVPDSLRHPPYRLFGDDDMVESRRFSDRTIRRMFSGQDGKGRFESKNSSRCATDWTLPAGHVSRKRYAFVYLLACLDRI